MKEVLKQAGVVHNAKTTVEQLYYLIQNSPTVKEGCSPQKCCCEKDVKSNVAAKKWL